MQGFTLCGIKMKREKRRKKDGEKEFYINCCPEAAPALLNTAELILD